MENNAAIGKFGVAFFALVALAFATAWIAGPGLSSARAENDGASASQLQDVQLNAAFANSAPFRDGLFQGARAKQRGEQARVSQSRWAFGEDQSAYELGYQHAFAKHSGTQPSTLDAELR